MNSSPSYSVADNTAGPGPGPGPGIIAEAGRKLRSLSGLVGRGPGEPLCMSGVVENVESGRPSLKGTLFSLERVPGVPGPPIDMSYVLAGLFAVKWS